MTYAIIKVAGKQYRVREGERLLVDRLAEDEGATFSPTVLLVGGNDAPALDPDLKVTAKVLGQVKGPKIRIGKYKRRTGYRRHTGFRSSLTQIEIEQIGDSKRSQAKVKAAKAEPEVKTRKPKAARPTEAAAATEPQPQQRAPQPRVKGLPVGYEDLTVAAIKEALTGWNRPMLEAALEYERAHANRKGAIAAIESALADKEGDA
jgi:large subunit ribosomal protein L21